MVASSFGHVWHVWVTCEASFDEFVRTTQDQPMLFGGDGVCVCVCYPPNADNTDQTVICFLNAHHNQHANPINWHLCIHTHTHTHTYTIHTLFLFQMQLVISTDPFTWLNKRNLSLPSLRIKSWSHFILEINDSHTWFTLHIIIIIIIIAQKNDIFAF